MTRVLVAEIPENAGRDLAVERAILGAGIELVQYACSGDEDSLIKACRDADVVSTDYSPLTSKVIRGLTRCRLISVAATGYDNVDLDAARQAGIRVCAIDEYCTDEVADHVMLLMLALCRRLPEYHEQVQQELRWQFDAFAGLARMRELTLGIVGFGRIGQAVARRARGFGMQLIAFDPCPNREIAAELGVRLCELETLFAEANVISLNCGLSDGNRNLLDATAFRQMKNKPFVINCARGALVDEAALLDALDSGQVSGAGLDVLAEESPDLQSSPLRGRNNVILTPHVAFYSDASILENRRVSASNIRHFLDGEHDRVRRYVS